MNWKKNSNSNLLQCLNKIASYRIDPNALQLKEQSMLGNDSDFFIQANLPIKHLPISTSAYSRHQQQRQKQQQQRQQEQRQQQPRQQPQQQQPQQQQEQQKREHLQQEQLRQEQLRQEQQQIRKADILNTKSIDHELSSQTGNGSKIASIPVVYSRQNNSRRVGNRFFHFHPNYAKEIIKFQQPYVSKKIVHLPKLLSPPPDLYALVHVRKSGMSSEKGTFEQALRTNKTLSYFPTVQKKKQLLLTYQPDLKISNVQPATSAIGIGSVWNNRGIADAILDVKCNLMVIFSPMAGVQLITDLMKHYLETDRFRQVDVRDYQNSRIKKIKLVRDPFNRAVGNYLRYIWEANSDDSFEMYLDSLLNNTRDNIQPIATIKNRNYQARIQTSDLDKYIHYFIKIEEIETGLIELDQRILSTFYHSYQAVKQTIINPYMIDLPADIFQVVENSENDKYVGNQSANYFRTLDDKFEIPPYHFFYNSLTRKKVEQIYNKDLNTYNYTRGGGAPLPL